MCLQQCQHSWHLTTKWADHDFDHFFAAKFGQRKIIPDDISSVKFSFNDETVRAQRTPDFKYILYIKLPVRKGYKLQLSYLSMTNSDKSHIFPFASEIIGREGGSPVTDKGTIKNLPKPTNQISMRKTYQNQNEDDGGEFNALVVLIFGFLQGLRHSAVVMEYVLQPATRDDEEHVDELLVFTEVCCLCKC